MQLEPQALKDLLQIISMPAGKQLIAMLQQKGGKELETALQNAKNGNYTDAQHVISSLLNNPEARKLLEQLGR